MTRLDLFIARMVSQRACIDDAVARTKDMTGPVYELGLGNGRTYHHMRETIAGRDIYVFERAVASHPDSRPEPGFLYEGDVFETLPQALVDLGPTASFIHADLGGHNREKNDAFARKISPYVEPHLAPGGIMVASDRMYFDALEELPLPAEAFEGRCFIYRKPA
ncbi:class I SAM-dependent methyltransferase [Sulfitobacter sp. S190]|uniref:class I SAM-dependent methyltransferase n=1 Tax=Sulfitobacter sp. S190 TaxID=2867022 RepID=UPI0021A651FB|nr:class I SAM-dependent methyltransferase [Sulfitobacter sp. S190]UWR24241.1 class I SAM-dependent methyltransferase [Sulfitobacter sp. S190]